MVAKVHNNNHNKPIYSKPTESITVFRLYVCIAVFALDDGLMDKSQYSEGPATGHLDTGFSWIPCVYKQMLRWLPTFQVATTCFSCSPPGLNSVVTISCFVYT